ncbi:MAG TPA: ABC transporter substrate-binding protein [Candidatus Binatia bacterium]|nr:ABC transporter substrate-binding protein [Candidatus Binatia bacterium]
MIGRSLRVGLILAAIGLAACASRQPAPPKPARALRVAVPTSSPPYAFQQGSSGLEVDFARELAPALGRELVLVPVEFTDLISTLRRGQADVVMAGMTITPAREVQVAFSAPYLRSGLVAVMRREDAQRYKSAASVLGTRGGVGVVAGTTGERFVRERIRLGSISVYPTAGAAMGELRQGRIDLVVHDAPVGLWFVSRDEANLAALVAPLDDEQLGWAFRRDDDALRAEVDRVLARWRADGTRERIVGRWLPYWQRLESAERPR